MMDRRTALKTIGAVPLTLAAVSSKNATANVSGKMVEVDLWMANQAVTAFFVEPHEANAPTGSVLLIHEWWGLNPQIKNVALKFGELGYLALAVDLYGGNVAADPDGARELMNAVHPDIATETLVTWIEWLRDHSNSNGKVGTVGWCFGGGWSLNASIATPVDATVIYYGRCAKGAEELGTLSGPVQGHFATRDKWINQEMVGGFEKAMDEAGKSYENFWYEADHAFANPTSERHDQEDAQLAWSRTLRFFDQHLS